MIKIQNVVMKKKVSEDLMLSLKKIISICVVCISAADVVYSQDVSIACDPKKLTALEAQVPDVKSAFETISTCLNSLDVSMITHTDINGNTVCADDPQLDEGVSLANFEIRLAAIEGYANTFCCTASECQANCPQAGTMVSTCDPDCKPHAPALLTTLEVVPRIQNIANRLRAVVAPATFKTTACGVTPSQPTQTTTTGLDDTVTGL